MKPLGVKVINKGNQRFVDSKGFVICSIPNRKEHGNGKNIKLY